MLAYYDYSISEAADLGRCVAADAPDAGVSLWSLPLDADAAARKSAAKSAFVRDRLCAGSAEVYERIVAYMSVATMEVTEPDDWYLSIIGILPDHQGRGLGGDLVRPVLEEADRAGRATYLETFTPRNISFYERLGYRAVGAFDEPVTGGTYTVLRRLPV